jgi:hypothetical protein
MRDTIGERRRAIDRHERGIDLAVAGLSAGVREPLLRQLVEIGLTDLEEAQDAALRISDLGFVGPEVDRHGLCERAAVVAGLARLCAINNFERTSSALPCAHQCRGCRNKIVQRGIL